MKIKHFFLFLQFSLIITQNYDRYFVQYSHILTTTLNFLFSNFCFLVILSKKIIIFIPSQLSFSLKLTKSLLFHTSVYNNTRKYNSYKASKQYNFLNKQSLHSSPKVLHLQNTQNFQKYPHNYHTNLSPSSPNLPIKPTSLTNLIFFHYRVLINSIPLHKHQKTLLSFHFNTYNCLHLAPIVHISRLVEE